MSIVKLMSLAVFRLNTAAAAAPRTNDNNRPVHCEIMRVKSCAICLITLADGRQGVGFSAAFVCLFFINFISPKLVETKNQ